MLESFKFASINDSNLSIWDNHFAKAMSYWVLITSLIGFLPTLYFRYTPQPHEPMQSHVILHGISFTLWVLLFIAQTQLVGRRQYKLHRKLGITSVVLLLVMIYSGFNTVLYPWVQGNISNSEAGFGLSQLTLGFIFVFLGIGLHRKPFIHKRLMICAAVALTFASADRTAWELGFGHIRELRRGLCVLPFMALILYDSLVWRRFPWIGLIALVVSWALLVFLVSRPFFMSDGGEWTLRQMANILGISAA